MQQRLGRYELGAVLGEGGMGRVYEAVLRGPGGYGRSVALKVLHSGSDELRREARLGGLLRHQNLVDVYEIGEVDGTWFAALERCDGEVAEHVPLPARALVEVGLQVCAALQYAHEELGLVHLDLKPVNLLLAEGVVKVADLGIAQARGFAGDGRVRGTPRYMAPEQVMGLAVDARTDVYALGITLYELASGWRKAVDGTVDPDTAVWSASTLDVVPDDPRLDALPELEPVPRWLQDLVERCTSPDPAARFQSMEALAEALAAVEAEGPGLREHIGWTEDRTTAWAPGGTNLLAPRDRLRGREQALARVVADLDQPGLLTLKGPAGIGKSRLAREAALRWHQPERQAWFVDLVDARTLADLPRTVGQTLGIPLRGAEPEELLEELVRSLVGRGPTVLILDNFEQIVHLAPQAGVLVDRCPELRVVVTSRRALGLEGERVVEVGPVRREAAVELLVDRARARGADVADDPLLGELADRLDGLPLALELAAGRLGVLSVADVLERLGLSMLRRGTEGRHGTLQAALDWSWELMEPAEHAALAQLSVFVGGFTLEAAEEVLELEEPVLDVVSSLVDRSMVQPLEEDRFGMLLSVRDYAAGHLHDAESTRLRHGRCFARYGTDDALGALNRHGGHLRTHALRLELGNLEAALAAAVERGDLQVAAGAGAAACDVAWRFSPLAGIRALLLRAVELEGAPADLARALTWCARAHSGAGQVDRAQELGRRALELALATDQHWVACAVYVLLSKAMQEAGELEGSLDQARRGLALARARRMRGWEAAMLNGIGLGHHALQRYDEALDSYHQALALYREVGNRASECAALGNLAGVHHHTGNLETARVWYDAAISLARADGNRRSEGVSLGNLGILLRQLGRPDDAREHYEAALVIHRELGNGSHISNTLSNLGRVEAEEGNLDEARALFERSLEVCMALGQRHTQAVAMANLGSLERVVGDAVAARRWFEQALELADEMGDGDLIGPIRGMLAELEA